VVIDDLIKLQNNTQSSKQGFSTLPFRSFDFFGLAALMFVIDLFASDFDDELASVYSQIELCLV
jgi:hypothetical protein